MLAADDIRGSVFAGGTFTALARIADWNGNILTQANTSSIAYTVYNPDGTTVTNQVAVSVDPTTTIFDTPVVDGLWSLDSIGYSFKYTIDVSTNPAFTTAGSIYLVVFTFTPTTGQAILVRYRMKAL